MGCRGLLLLLCMAQAGSVLAAEAGDVVVAAGGPAAATAAPAAPPVSETAATPAATPPSPKNPDPWQKFNRAVFRFNDVMDRYALKPVAKGYKKVTPSPVRTGISNFFVNLASPVVMLNDLLQGKVRAAGSDTARFVVNSTLGLAGFIDISSRMGIPLHDEDFGQTLGVWGVPSGPYLVLPFFGPSSVRDTAGFGVDILTNPRTYLLNRDENWALTGMDVVSVRASLLDVEEIVQGDRYLFIRDLYLQRREYAVKDGKVDDPFLDDSGDQGNNDGGGGGTETPPAGGPATAPKGVEPPDAASPPTSPEASASPDLAPAAKASTDLPPASGSGTSAASAEPAF